MSTQEPTTEGLNRTTVTNATEAGHVWVEPEQCAWCAGKPEALLRGRRLPSQVSAAAEVCACGHSVLRGFWPRRKEAAR